MDAQRFLAEFGHIANAPGGISILQGLVLSLAVRGDLIRGENNDEPASTLLQAVQQERAKLIGRIVLPKPITDAEQPYPLPESWEWVRCCEYFLELCTGPFGSMIHEEDYVRDGVPLINPSHMAGGRIVHDPRVTVKREDAERLSSYSLSNGDIVLARRGEVGRYAIVEEGQQGWLCGTGSFFAKLPAACNRKYLGIVFREASFRQRLSGDAVGITMTNLNQRVLLNTLIPIPPLDEQSRIVAKVDELMALCDKLDAQQQARRNLQNNLRQSTLQAVASATSPHELQTTWTRLADNFGRLFHAPEDVADLRKMITELAIRGALDAFSEPTDVTTVDVYLAELASKKSGKRFAKVGQVEEDISLPNGWRWVLMEDLLADSESGWSPKCDAEPRRIGEWGVLKVSAVTWGAFNSEENKRLPSSLEPRPECEVKPGDFMLSRANTAELVARSVIAPDDCPEKLLMSDKIVRLIFLDNKLKPWVNLVNNSEMARTYYKEKATGTSDSMRNVSRQVIHELPIPLPSLQVQKRVLQALNQLMRFCDELERQASSRMKLSGQFSKTAVSSLTGIATEQEEEPMKAPQTELIAPLRLGKTPDIKAQAPLATILARHNGEMPAKDLWQRFGGEIDAFYAQLKTEVAHGWIVEPTMAEMREKRAESAGT